MQNSYKIGDVHSFNKILSSYNSTEGTKNKIDFENFTKSQTFE